MPCTAVDQDIYGNTGSGNIGDYIEVRGGDIPSDITWRNQDQKGLPLIVTGDIVVGRDYTSGYI